MNIRTYGTDERLGFCREYLYTSKTGCLGEIVLLPIPTSRGGALVPELALKEEEIYALCDEYSSIAEDMCAVSVFGELAVVGYGIPKDMKHRLSDKGALVIDVSLDEDFLLENARLTAVAAAAKILSEENAAPGELTVGIIGYGRIGKRLLNILSLLGGKPTVFTSNENSRIELGMMGLSAVSYGALESEKALRELGHFDILINTAPDMLVKAEAVNALSDTKIIELASGNNFPSGLNVLRLPSLPAKAYPKSSGRALADSVLRMLGERTLK